MRLIHRFFLVLSLLLIGQIAFASNEIQSVGTSGATLYAVIINQVGLLYNGTTNVTLSNANWSSSAAMTEQGTTGIFFGNFPSGLAAGRYSILVYVRAGGAPAVTDTLNSQGVLNWDGSALVTEASINTQTVKIGTNNGDSANQTASQNAVTTIQTRLGSPVGASISADIANSGASLLGLTASSYNTAGTIGAKINSGGSGGSGSGTDPLTNSLSTYTTAGTAGYLLNRLYGMTNSSGQFTAGAFGLLPNVTIGGYATGQDPATLVWAKSLETGATPVNVLDAMRLLASYAAGNTNGADTYYAAGDSTKTRITYSINSTTKARTITLSLTP